MKLFERINDSMLSLYFDCLTQFKANRADNRRSFAIGAFIGILIYGGGIAMADDDIAGFGNSVLGIINQIYDAVFGVVTALAAVLAVIALIVRMSGNQQRSAQATQWLIRIVVTYVAINCLGLITKVINNTTKDYRFTTTTGTGGT